MDARSLQGSISRLRDEFDGLVSPETVDELFRQSTNDLAASARVDNFVPLLVERRTRERLKALTHTRAQ